MSNKKEVEVPWAESKAKKFLIAEIMVGNITDSSKYDQIYYSNQEYQKYPKKNFRSNLKNLIISLEKKRNVQHSTEMRF
jgi:hypothetical protein